MKRTIVLTILSLFGLTTVHAQQQFATLQHGDNLNAYYGADALVQAHAAAVSGDIITLSEGTFQSTTISKAVTIRGAGMYPDSVAGTLPTVISGNMTLLYNGTVENHIILEGLRFINTLVYGDFDVPDISYLEMTKCEIEELKGGCYFDARSNYPRSYLQYAQFVDCIIKDLWIRTKHPDYNEWAINFHNHIMHSNFINCAILLVSNIFHIDWQTVEDLHYNTINNCVVCLGPNYLNAFDLTISNSIFYSIFENDGENTTMPTVYNSIGIHRNSNNYFDSSILANQNLHNYNSLSMVFKNFNGTYNYDSTTFELNDSVAATIMGNDGTQVGLYGGSAPFNSRVQNYFATVANQSRPDGKLELTIQPVAQSVDSSVSYWFDGADGTMTTQPIDNGLVLLNVEELTDTTHTVYLILGNGRMAQLQSHEFMKVPVVYTVTLATADSTMGSVSGGGDYPRHSTATVAATAEYGYLFSHWSDGDTNALRSIYLTQDTALTAYFVPDTFSFDIAVGDTAMGMIIVNGDGSYLSDDTATAVPNYGYHFVGWSDGDTTNPRVVTLTQNTVLTAIFAPNVYTVTLASENPEWGSAIGSGEYEYLTVVPLEAVAVYGYQFKQWNDGNTQNPRQLVVRGDTTLTATFELLRYNLTVVSNDPSRGFTQGGGTFTVMDTATALAITLAGNSFLGWADGDMTNPRQLQLSSDTTLTAIFQALNSMPETIIVHDTTVVTDTLTLTLHDTTYIDIPVHDTTVLVDTLLVDHYIYDTIDNYIYVTDTVTMTEYVPVHDTTYIDVPVHDTTIVTLTDTVVNTVYDTVDNYIYDTVTNTVYDTVTNTVYDTVDNFIYDTTIVTDTLWQTLYDTVWMTDTVYIHDTVYVPENGIDGVATTNIRLYQRDGQIVVEDADGGVLPEVVVYDAVGRKMETGFAGGAPAYQFEVPASGVYLVKIGDRPARRIVVIR